MSQPPCVWRVPAYSQSEYDDARIRRLLALLAIQVGSREKAAKQSLSTRYPLRSIGWTTNRRGLNQEALESKIVVPTVPECLEGHNLERRSITKRCPASPATPTTITKMIEEKKS